MTKVTKVHRAQQGFQDPLDTQGKTAPPGKLALKAYPENRVKRVNKVKLVLQVHRVPKVTLANRVLQVSKVIKVLKDCLVTKD